MNQRKIDLALALYQCGAIKFGAFKLKLHEKHPDAPLSPIYLNLRAPDNKGGTLTPEIFAMIGQVLAETVNLLDLKFQHVCGIPKAGEPFVDALQTALANPLIGRIYLEKIEGADTRRVTKVTTGTYMPEDVVLPVDDLITHADSKIETVDALAQSKLRVTDILVLVDREQGGREELAKHGLTLHSAYTLTELLSLYVDRGLITPEKCDEVLLYLAANRS